VRANQLVTTRIATLEDIEVFTTEPTPSWVLRANCRNEEDKPSLQRQERQWLLPLPLHGPSQSLILRILSLGARKRTDLWHRKRSRDNRLHFRLPRMPAADPDRRCYCIR